MASQTVRPGSTGDSLSAAPISLENTADSSLSESLIVLKKRRVLVLAVLLVGLAIGLYKSLTQTKIYDASAKIEVRSGASQEFKVDPAQILNQDSTANKMAAEVVILQSDSLLLSVAREMNLCNNPDFLGVPGPLPYTSIDDLNVREATLKQFHDNLKIQLVPKTDIIRISYSSLNAKLSSDIVNHLVADYIQRSYETRYLSTQRVSQWLSGQLDDLKRQVETSQEQMIDLQRKLGMLGFEPDKNQNATTLEDLSVAVVQARIARILAEARYREMASMDPNTIEDSIDPTRGPVPLVLTQIRTQIAVARATLADLQATLGPNHPQVKSQRANLDALEKEEDAEQGRLLAQAKENFVIAKASEARVLDSLEQQKKASYLMRDDLVEYTLRLREFESNRTLYEGLLQRLRTAGVEAGLESLEIDIVDPAVPAAAPTLKAKTTILITAFIISGIIGTVLAFMLESLDTGLNRIADIESITQLPSLAIVPRIRKRIEPREHLSVAQQNLVSLSSPKSQFAEAIRSLRTSLLLSTTGRRPKYILFTSATPSEGKTTISTNTACILAQGGTRVLMIDADLRRPSVHQRLGLSGKFGLSTLLTGGSRFEETIQTLPEMPSLDIIASGPIPPFPAELLGSEAMRAMLANAAVIYDYIVIDSPPVLSVTDGVVLARTADAVVLVVRHGKSSKHIVRRARDLLLRAGAPITGIVLNVVDITSVEFQGYYGHTDYYTTGNAAGTWDAQNPPPSKPSEQTSAHSEKSEKEAGTPAHSGRGSHTGDRE
jgi:capsular exopolysaccharide synthesis family protein